jgi:hypothetical protein
MGTWGKQKGRLTYNLPLFPRLRIRGAVPSIPHTTSWHVQLPTGVALPFMDEFSYTCI